MSKGKRKPARPVDMEKRLATAYDAGYYDGFVEGVKSTHEIWVDIAERTKGVGPKLQKAIIETAKVVMAERHDANFGKPPQDVADVRNEINNVMEETNK